LTFKIESSDHNIQSLFPSPVYSSKVYNFIRIQDEITSCIDQVEFDMREDWGQTAFLSDITFTENIIGKYNLNCLRCEIDQHLRKYCSFLEFNVDEYDCNISSSWLALFKKGNYGQLHSHGDADISGCYYYKTNGEDGDIFFESSNLNLEASKCYSNLSGRFRYTPTKGQILLFPGWMKHGIMTNMTDNTRISLAFNMHFLKK